MFKILFLALFSVAVQAGDAVLNWTAPTTYEDGTPLSASEIKGYVVYYGTTSGGPYSSSVVSTTTSATINVPKGTWYFVATCIGTNDLESARSNEVSKVILSSSKPRPPKLN